MFDLSKLAKFARKKYRDSYLQTQVRGGIAYQMQALREKFGLTQLAFAEKTGKKQSVISRLENTEYGRASVQTLLDIACALDIALLVKFVSYPEFLERTKDMTILALQPETISESLAQTKQLARAWPLINIRRAAQQPIDPTKMGTSAEAHPSPPITFKVRDQQTKVAVALH